MHATRTNHSRSGFTLVELSIVLAIIGVIVGALVVGQTLIRSSEINSVGTDIQKYKAAFQQFKVKYNYWPGDLPTAYDYWPNAGCKNIQAGNGNASTGCNGNGDGNITTWMGGATEMIEMWRAWQHLALSGMLPGRYTGVMGPSGCPVQAVFGTNSPATRINGVGFIMYTVIDYSSLTGPSSGLFAGDYPNGFLIGRLDSATPDCGTTFGIPRNAFLTPAEASGMDAKYDDSRPGLGKVRAVFRDGNCTSSQNSQDFQIANYNLTYQGEACALHVNLE